MAYSENWYLEWFDSAYYHILYQHRDEEEAALFIRHLFEYLNIPKTLKVLDLACGKGRHAQQIHRLGYDVLGVDLSIENIKQAQRLEERGMTFLHGDMRDLPFEAEFDLVLNLFTSFGYFEDDAHDQKTINSMTSALKENGILVIDYLNVVPTLRQLPETKLEKRGAMEFNIEKTIVGKFIRKHIQFEDKGEKYNYEEFVKCLQKERFEQMFAKAGLKLLHLFGDYTLKLYEKEHSPRLILIAQKTPD
ncbi:MAG: SAM-dependent methyltransferase [Verrucomicrobia bacterium]|nr:SAM-dependent methyltransferase [Verrucomicrobiota bacterium]